MNAPDWLSDFLNLLGAYSERAPYYSGTDLAPAHLLKIAPENWSRAADTAARLGYRHAGFWGTQHSTGYQALTCFEFQGNYLMLETELGAGPPSLASHTPFYPIASRQERHCSDLLGITFSQSSDPRRWTRHQAWTAKESPLRRDFSVLGEPPRVTPPDGNYPFQRISGAGVYEIPVGPVHAGIIEPGHFRFNAVGEEVLSLEQHLGYTHKGIEKIAVGRTVEELIRLAARVSGDSTVSYSWAACQAVERAWRQPAPRWVEQMRGLMAERERVANHLGDIGGICNDVGFAFAQFQCTRLKEDWLRRNQELFGHRFMMDCVLPGACAVELNSAAIAQLGHDHSALQQQTTKLFDLLDDQPSLEDRLLNTGYLSRDSAAKIGCTGYTGKASGNPFDVRTTCPYAPYDRLPISSVELQAGDVAARMQVRMQEIAKSLDWMNKLLSDLLKHSASQAPVCPGYSARGVGMVDGWRGEILCYVALDAAGRVTRFFPRDPSWYLWPALERAFMGNIVPDFPVCNKSINGSYSGVDL